MLSTEVSSHGVPTIFIVYQDMLGILGIRFTCTVGVLNAKYKESIREVDFEKWISRFQYIFENSRNIRDMKGNFF